MGRRSCVVCVVLLAAAASYADASFRYDFEDGQMPFQGGQGASISREESHSGSYSMKLAGNKGGLGWYTAPGVSGMHWGRVWFKLNRPSGFAHMSLVAFSHASRNEMRVVDTVWGDWAPDKHQYLLNFADDQGGKATEYDWEIGRWKCAEWHLDGSAKKFTFWEDGKEVMEVQEDAIPNSYSETRVGLMVWQDNVDVSAFIDDFAIAESRIGCEASGTDGGDSNPDDEDSTVECSTDEEDCRVSRCCATSSKTCYEKDQHWASCKDSCTPGIDANDPEKFQTPWSCKVLGGPSDPGQQPSDPGQQDGLVSAAAFGSVPAFVSKLVGSLTFSYIIAHGVLA